MRSFDNGSYVVFAPYIDRNTLDYDPYCQDSQKVPPIVGNSHVGVLHGLLFWLFKGGFKISSGTV